MERTKYAKKEKAALRIPDISIPPQVLFNPSLTSTEKLLFGILQNLAQEEEGCCRASNNYLGNLLGVGSQTVSNSIAKLKRYEFIEVSMEEQNGFNINRKIFINPKFSKIRHDAMVKIENQLKSDGLQK